LCRGFPDYRPEGAGYTLQFDGLFMPSSLGRVLVVEDEPEVGAMLLEVLVQLGYTVELADRGAEALRLVPAFEPDVVLLDLTLPEMSGSRYSITCAATVRPSASSS
jgi:CheY-like chemotaxis protein